MLLLAFKGVSWGEIDPRWVLEGLQVLWYSELKSGTGACFSENGLAWPWKGSGGQTDFVEGVHLYTRLKREPTLPYCSSAVLP